MRSLIVIAVVLVALVVGSLLIVPRLVVWDDYRDELTRQAEALTGQPVEIGGHIELSLLPRPTLSLADTSIGRRSDAPDQPVLHIDRLEVQLEPWPLLRGAVEVGELHMVRPVLHL
ncbi:MAG: AsmA family protein, partial [Geminicoccales bacterium]